MRTLSQIVTTATICKDNPRSRRLCLDRVTWDTPSGLRFRSSGHVAFLGGMHVTIYYSGAVDFSDTCLSLTTVWDGVEYAVMLNRIGNQSAESIRRACIVFARRIMSDIGMEHGNVF